MQFKTIDSNSLADILLGRAGLIVDPGATVNTNVYTELAKALGLTPPAGRVTGLRALGSHIACRSGATSFSD
jgi:hypothetical protein